MVKRAAPPQQGLSGDDIFLKVEAEPMQAYPAAQILLNVQLYRAVSTDNASLSPPESDDPDLLVKKAGRGRTVQKTNIGGRRYLVERRYALFTQNGTSTWRRGIPGEVLKPGSRRDNLFGSPLADSGAPGDSRSPVNQSALPSNKSPSCSRRTLAAEQQSAAGGELGRKTRQFTVGEPVTRTLMLFADG